MPTPSSPRPGQRWAVAAALVALPLLLAVEPVGGFAPPLAVAGGTVGGGRLFVGGFDFDPDGDGGLDGRTREEEEAAPVAARPKDDATTSDDPLGNWLSSLTGALTGALTAPLPPPDVDDADLLLYDVVLLVNLSASLSFMVVHRLDPSYLPSGLHEGAVLSICWILAGLANGAFLRSAVDGHYDLLSEEYDAKGGPRGAGLLAVSTFVTTSSLRIIFALAAAVAEHRRVGVGGEELIPLEIVFGVVLMSAWRCAHSANTPRI